MRGGIYPLRPSRRVEYAVTDDGSRHLFLFYPLSIMLQRDYISRLIREFMAALQRYLEKDELTGRRKAAEDLYRQYLGDYAFYHTAGLDEVMSSFERYPEEERLSRIEMLAELYYAEADSLTEPLRTRQLGFALSLFGFIDRHSRTFSIDRANKISDIGNRLRGRE